ncbi:MAG: Tim44 domain-containing protein [Desulfobacterales bacterium]
MQTVSKKKITLTALATLLFFMVAGFMEVADARSRGGGRSFKRPAASKPAQQSQPRQTATSQSTNPTGAMGSPFVRGLAGGIMGGFLGSMLFGGMAHGMGGGGGLGGSGFGLFEILLLAGLGFFIYRWFSRRKALASNTGAEIPQDQTSPARLFSGVGAQQETQDNFVEDPLVTGVKEIWTLDDTFDPEAFKEKAQDLFFKIQAGWTRRDISVLKPFVGNQLLDEYAQYFAEMKQQGHINRLENIAVRNVELIDAGVQKGEIFVTVRFTANLLDYTVDEKTGEIVKGDNENSVKFEEDWSFATPVGSHSWKLEGINV